MKKLLFILFSLSGIISYAQKPVIKVDLNISGRNNSEVNEPGYTPWVVKSQVSDSATFSGVKIVFTVKSPANAILETGWSKQFVQSPYFARLANDGIYVDHDYIVDSLGQGGDIEMRISGLSVGQHTIQTYHNSWSGPDKYDYCPINVYLNNKLIHSNISRTNRVGINADATTLYTKLNVEKENQEMVILFESIKTFKPSAGKTAEINVSINGFEINTPDASKQAREPLPDDADLHADADSNFLTLKWKPAINGKTKNHIVYFGTDSATVADANTSNTSICLGSLQLDKNFIKVEGLYSMKKHFWRVDQMDSTGWVTQGNIWSFRPRQLAFRGAEGYGRFATGGRGGKVVEVTNLNDDGPGSLREAVTKDVGPRTIVFNVSGIISLNSRLVMSQDFITIAGQTAPGKGICIKSAPFGVGGEAICRFLRVRLGAGPTYDGLGMAGGKFSIIDHSSISWTIDEAFSSRGAHYMTLQRTLISEALNIAGHQNYPEGTAHGYAATIGGDIGTFHHNLLAHCSGRNWSLGGGLDGNGYYAGRMDIFNNVVYNWGTRATDGGAHEVNFVGNYYKKGAATTQNTILVAQLEGTGKGSQSYYYAGNVVENTNGTLACNGTDNTCSRIYKLSNGQAEPTWQVFVDQPFFPSYAKIETAKDAYKSVLSDVGCTMPMFDDHDKRIIKETLNGTFTYTGSKSKKGGLIDHQDEAGGYENYPQETRPVGFDSDHDGLPDWWEKMHASNVNSANGDFSDSNADPDKDGYTALEDYLEWMSVPHYNIAENKSDTVDLSGYTAAYINPQYSTVKANKLNTKYNSKSIIVTPDSNFTGITYLDVKAVDSEGSSITRTIGFCVSNEVLTDLPVIKNDMRIMVYPVNFDNQLTIETETTQNKAISMVLYDLIGKEMLRKNFDLQAGHNRLNLKTPSSLPSQVYLLELADAQTGKKYDIKRIIKK